MNCYDGIVIIVRICNPPANGIVVLSEPAQCDLQWSRALDVAGVAVQRGQRQWIVSRLIRLVTARWLADSIVSELIVDSTSTRTSDAPSTCT